MDSVEAEDPFDCFDSSSEEEDTSCASSPLHRQDNCPGHGGSAATNCRPSDCGVLAFHPNTEEALLAHVRNALGARQKDVRQDCTASEGSKTAMEAIWVLEAIDEFCQRRHWMMHVGPEKGKIVGDALRDSIESFLDGGRGGEDANEPPRSKDCFVCVELGTYCGYASVLLGNTLRHAEQRRQDQQLPKKDFHLYTFEINPQCIAVASEVIRLAQLEDVVSIVPLSWNADGSIQHVDEALRIEMQKREDSLLGHEGKKESRSTDEKSPQMIGFCFIDHDKDMYLADLQRLERSGMVDRGTRVAADNVVFARIDNYVSYVQELARNQICVTETVETQLEYSEVQTEDGGPSAVPKNQFMDGVELTTYLQSHCGG